MGRGRSTSILLILISLAVCCTTITGQVSFDDNTQSTVSQPSIRCTDDGSFILRRKRDTKNDENTSCYFRDFFSLACIYGENDVSAKVSWRHNGAVVDPEIVENNIIRGGNTTQGYYQCVVNTSVGLVVSPLSLVRQAALTMKTKSSQQTVDSGQLAVLNCPFIAVGEINTVKWTFQKEGADRKSKVDVNCLDSRCLKLQNGTLLLINATDRDIGTYECSVTLLRRVAFSNIKLDVTQSVDSQSNPFRLSFHSERRVLMTNGRNTTLTCIFGNRTIVGGLLMLEQVVWTAPNRGNVTVGYGWQFEPKEAGIYQCNGQYKLAHASYFLTGINFTVDAEAGARIVRRPKAQKKTAGSHVTFTCEATGVPLPTIAWIIDGKVLDGESGHLENSNTTWQVTSDRRSGTDNVNRLLHIGPLYRSHIVQCNASNEHSTQLTSSDVIIVNSVPEPYSTTPANDVRSLAESVGKIASTLPATAGKQLTIRRRPSSTTLKQIKRSTITDEKVEGTPPSKEPNPKDVTTTATSTSTTASRDGTQSQSTPLVTPKVSVMVAVIAATTSGVLVVVIALITAIVVGIMCCIRRRKHKQGNKIDVEDGEQVSRSKQSTEGLSRCGSTDSGISEIRQDIDVEQPLMAEAANHQIQPKPLDPIEETDETVSLSTKSEVTSRSRSSSFYEPCS